MSRGLDGDDDIESISGSGLAGAVGRPPAVDYSLAEVL